VLKEPDGAAQGARRPRACRHAAPLGARRRRVRSARGGRSTRSMIRQPRSTVTSTFTSSTTGGCGGGWRASRALSEGRPPPPLTQSCHLSAGPLMTAAEAARYIHGAGCSPAPADVEV